ncbi:hypothetical protein J31TS6_40280 [Brevibacillus reuszeri]|uniref:hypothetical protein n=1 Tax=Brevibacillus reuszeri TaxID=54915 RepID=UPI001B2B5C88|nr:hypothetical protein [Brevibacillus reuszeri]GIO08000.1 hypothetical protein J31TS6_40280 [Brevibacillus reuszeri]
MDISKAVKVIDGRLCLSSAAICEVLDIHRNTLQNYTKAGLPKTKTGWFDLGEVIRWRAEREGAKGSGEDESHAQMKLRYEAELKREQAAAATLKNAIANGEYVKRDDVVSELQRFFVTLRRSMGGFSRKVAMEIAPYVDPDQVRIIEQNITDTTNAVLLQLSVRGVYDAKK